MTKLERTGRFLVLDNLVDIYSTHGCLDMKKDEIIEFLKTGSTSGIKRIDNEIDYYWVLTEDKIEAGDKVIFDTSGKYNPGFNTTNTYDGVVVDINPYGMYVIEVDGIGKAYLPLKHITQKKVNNDLGIVAKIRIMKQEVYNKMLSFGSASTLDEDKMKEYKDCERLYYKLTEIYVSCTKKGCVTFIETGKFVEYKHFCFADVSLIIYNKECVGWKYEDKSSVSGKTWYSLLFDSNKESVVTLTGRSCFGEDCIYCHSVDEIKSICDRIMDIPSIMSRITDFNLIQIKNIEQFKIQS